MEVSIPQPFRVGLKFLFSLEPEKITSVCNLVGHFEPVNSKVELAKDIAGITGLEDLFAEEIVNGLIVLVMISNRDKAYDAEAIGKSLSADEDFVTAGEKEIASYISRFFEDAEKTNLAEKIVGQAKWLKFLAEGDSFTQVLETDKSSLASLGVTKELLGETLIELCQAADDWFEKNWTALVYRDDMQWSKELSEIGSIPLDFGGMTQLMHLPIEGTGYVDGDLQVFVTAPDARVIRYIHCPWHGTVVQKDDYHFFILNRKIGEFVVTRLLSGHLISEHGFFDGKGSDYRIEPVALARVLGLSSASLNEELLRLVGHWMPQRDPRFLFDRSLPRRVATSLEHTLMQIYREGKPDKIYLVGRTDPVTGLVALSDQGRLSITNALDEAGIVPNDESLILERAGEQWELVSYAGTSRETLAGPLSNKEKFNIDDLEFMIFFCGGQDHH